MLRHTNHSCVIFNSRCQDLWCQDRREGRRIDLTDPALLDSGSLPSAWGTRQRPNCTRQSLCRVRHSAKKSDHHGAGLVDGHFAECQPCRHSAKIFLIFFKKFLCWVPTREALGKDFLFFLKKFFAECQPVRHSAKIFFFFAQCQHVKHSAKSFNFF